MDKQQILAAAIAQLETTLAETTARAKEAADSATHEEARSEDKHDTRATEASYLARGTAQRAVDLRHDLALLRSLSLRDFTDQPIAAGALVALEDEDGAERIVLLAPAGGGTTVGDGDRVVQLVTPSSPLGAALLEQEQGDEVPVRIGGRRRLYAISAVS